MTELLGISDSDVELMKSLLPEKYTEVELHAKGKRGVVFKAKLDSVPVAIKVAHPKSDAHNAMSLEQNYVAKANTLGIGPKLIEGTEFYVAMEFIEGKPIGEFIEAAGAQELRTVFLAIIQQLLVLDKAGINKFELTNPYKHILIKENLEPVLIDFERARFAARVKNISQFAEYLTHNKVLLLLQAKGLLSDVTMFKKNISNYVETGELSVETLL